MHLHVLVQGWRVPPHLALTLALAPAFPPLSKSPGQAPRHIMQPELAMAIQTCHSKMDPLQ